MNAFVLAGGQSTRMGRDKALLEVEGRPLVVHMLERLRGLGLEARISGSRPDLERFAPVVADNFPKTGPLGGIEAALAVSDSELNLFVAIDTPRIPTEFLRWLMMRAETSEAVATIPYFANRPQPLCAVYGGRLLVGIRSFLAAGDHKVMHAVRAAAALLGEPVDEFHVESIAPLMNEWPSESPVSEWFRNANTPSEYEALCAGAKRRHPIS